MARVFIHDADVETAVAVREAAAADGHDAEILPDLDGLERRLGGEDTFALVLTGDPGDRAARRAAAQMSTRIPRPPLLVVVDAVSRSAAASLEADVVLSTPVEAAEVQVALGQELERFELQVATGIVGRTEAMREVLERINTIAQVQSTVLITGESGTGKELVARGIHGLSPRRGRPFIAVNCGAIPESLLESELFGHEKGAFTDAKTRKKGLVELAEGGTLFLDEIGEMGITLQSRLLRVLENKTFRRVGGVKDLTVNTRIISATNRDLEAAIEEKIFRQDLYYRLKVIPLTIPPLRQRKEDIPLLVNHFVDRFNRELGKKVKPVGREVIETMLRYDWPGNVRELRNVIERAMLLDAEDDILVGHLPPEIRGAEGEAPTARASASVVESFFPMTLREVERIQIEKTLSQTNGNKSKAANILGISRQTLREKLKTFKAADTEQSG